VVDFHKLVGQVETVTVVELVRFSLRFDLYANGRFAGPYLKVTWSVFAH